MRRKESILIRLFQSKVWLVLGVGAAAASIAVAVQMGVNRAFVSGQSPAQTVLLALCVALAAPVGLYAVVAASVLSRRLRRSRAGRDRLDGHQRQIAELKHTQIRQRARIDELATLREVAYVVNRETDFAIIIEKVLELVDGLLEPVEACVFVLEEAGAPLTAFAQRCGGKFLIGRKVLTHTIPAFSLGALESHGLICRVYGQELHAIIALKVDEEILGVLFLVFPTDEREDTEQVRDFNRRRRTLLQEIAQHISLSVKTKHLLTRSVTDGLTRLYSKSHFSMQLEAHLDFAARNGADFSLILIDIDHFKKVNDTHGHASGDAVLAGVGETIRCALRKYDSGYRVGGEELAVLLPRTDLERGVLIAERLRTRVQNKRFRAEGGGRIHVTVSCGVAQSAPGDTPDAIFSRADSCLYRAKKTGRNRVVSRPA